MAGRNIKIYVQPHPIIRHMTFSETMDALDSGRKSSVMSSEFFVEAAAYRQVARYIKMGIVKFPRRGCEQLPTQLLSFGVEKHDDGMDALVYLILGLVGEGISPQEIHSL